MEVEEMDWGMAPPDIKVLPMSSSASRAKEVEDGRSSSRSSPKD